MKIIALMSGSSLDGLDIGYMEIWEDKDILNYRLITSELSPYSKLWYERLYDLPKVSALSYVKTKADYSMLIANKVLSFIQKHRINPDIISWHGHTTFHLPQENISEQIGEGGIMASTTGIKTITDFRISDIALGGQGTPIAPIVEKLLFPNYDYYLNLGGIANISIHMAKKILAYDNCPANQLLNYLCQSINKEYDEDGNMAKSGKVNKELLKELLDFEYYKKSAPKSLDNNWIRKYYFPIFEKYNIPIEDKLASTVEFITTILLKDLTLTQNIHFSKKPKKLFITGGGAYNKYLISALKSKLKTIHIEVIIPSNEIIEYKETILMGLMGYLRIKEKNNVLSSVTGARKNSIGGAIYV